MKLKTTATAHATTYTGSTCILGEWVLFIERTNAYTLMRLTYNAMYEWSGIGATCKDALPKLATACNGFEVSNGATIASAEIVARLMYAEMLASGCNF